MAEFDRKFWLSELEKLGYAIDEKPIPVQFLRERKAIPPGINLKQGHLIYSDPLTFDVVVLEFDKLPTRTSASRIARYWKRNQQGRQLLIFTDNSDSYAVVIPGAVESQSVKARILSISGMLYRTDIEALSSLRLQTDNKIIRDDFDNNFLPYEKVRAEFFDGYRSLYQRIFEIVKVPLGDNAHSYSQRFLGRLMFLYFLQKKGWLMNDRRFVDTVKDYTKLNWIFYNGLSQEGNDGLPYLDGTLFEREEYFDGKTEEKIRDGMTEVFIEARKFFNSYNFTVDELSPADVEVSVDPAMIGTIFENMLPENERGSKGTFYTPPAEISFICRRALSAYLKIPEPVNGNGGREEFMDGISSLIESLNKERSEKRVRELREKILSITVMDPSVGSGGFLLGMMHEMIDLLRHADESVGWNPDVEEYKSRILRNLFGFDIEDEAIEIARLRLWLSMIVDKKEPEPLQSLDMNIVKISDSLLTIGGVQRKLGDELDSTWDEMRTIREKFATAKKPDVRSRLRKELQKIQNDMEKETGVRGGIIESWVPKPVDIIVMNPPYVRQESIPPEKKKYYVSNPNYNKLDKKSDLYCYFVLRALKLINDNGIVSVISSDKWLETGYGEDLQKMISSRLIGIYGQRERTFGADVNSIIFVYGSETDSSKTTDFVYLESYSSPMVRNHVQFRRMDLKPGKWFYLRAPKLFMEKIYPKLTHKLGDFAEIKFGIKTGANDFFYMKDVSPQYEADYLSNPKKFEDWGVTAKNEKELKEQGLIYIENLLGERFILDKSDTSKVVKSPRELDKYVNEGENLKSICLYTTNPGKHSLRYIDYGEQHKFHLRPSTKSRTPWYSLKSAKSTHLLITVNQMDRLFNPYVVENVLVDKMFYLVYSRTKEIEKLFLVINSTPFFFLSELYGLRMGGGGGILTNTVEGYENMPIWELNKMDLSGINVSLLRGVKKYYEEIRMEDRRKLDSEILKSMGVDNISLEEFYNEFVELVDDRLIKANRGLKSREIENEQDN